MGYGVFPDVAAWLLSAVRIAGMVAFAPPFSSRSIPTNVRVYLAVGLGGVVGAYVSGRGQSGAVPGIATPGIYIGAVVTELAIGAVIGYGVSLLFEAVRFAGDMIDVQMGLGQSTALDPTSNIQATVVSRAYYFVAVIIFLQMNGHHWLIAGLNRSYELIPLGGAGYSRELSELIIDLVGSIFTIGLRVAAPVIASVFLTDIGFGLIARVVPQMNVFLVGIPAKLLVGLGVLGVSAPLLFYTLSQLISDMKVYVGLFVRVLSGV